MKSSLARMIVLCLLPSFASAASTITGSVRNQTTGQPAVADEVILLRLLDGMQEEARTSTDAQGGFAFNAQLPQGRYLVRVMHQAVNYDREASVGGALSIDVFDAATQVKAVTGKAEIIRIGSVGNSLSVSDMYDIVNDSTPPLTQAGERNFEFYLPAKASITSILAAGPGSRNGVKISASPVKNEPGHYALNFPLRPGETKFAINYELPYDGHAVLRPKLFYPVQQLDVVFPPSMAFHSQSSSFHPLLGNKDFQVQAASQVKAGAVSAFEISGDGAPPSISARARTQPQPRTSAQMPSATASTSKAPAAETFREGNGVGSKAVSAQTRSLIFPAVIGLILVAGAGLLLWHNRQPKAAAGTAAPATNSANRPAGLLEVVKEELFQLEKEKLRGAISREEYATAKQALDVAVARAMAKAAAQKS